MRWLTHLALLPLLLGPALLVGGPCAGTGCDCAEAACCTVETGCCTAPDDAITDGCGCTAGGCSSCSACDDERRQPVADTSTTLRVLADATSIRTDDQRVVDALAAGVPDRPASRDGPRLHVWNRVWLT